MSIGVLLDFLETLQILWGVAPAMMLTYLDGF